MSYNNFRESRLRFSDSLNGQRWIFLRKGLDDFRDGFPSSSDNTIVYGKKLPVSIIVKNSTGNSSYTAPGKKSKKCTKPQIYLSKLIPLQQARRDYIAQTERCLKRQPTVLYPHLEKKWLLKDTLPLLGLQLFKEVAGVLGPEILFKSKAGYRDHQRETQTPQEVQDHMEDKQMKVTSCKKLVQGVRDKMRRAIQMALDSPYLNQMCGKRKLSSKESPGKKACTLLSKKKVTAGGKKATQSHLAPLDEHTKEAGTAVLMKIHKSLLHSSSESPLQQKRGKVRYGAWYFDPRTWRKEIVNKPLEAPEEAINSLGNAKHHLSEKEMEVALLHSTPAFKEFLERKGYPKPRFLLKMLIGGNDSGAQEEIDKSSKRCCPERNDKIRESSSTAVNTDF